MKIIKNKKQSDKEKGRNIRMQIIIFKPFKNFEYFNTLELKCSE